MDFRRKLRILVSCLVLLAIHIGGELNEDFKNICDFCQMDGLVDCSVLDVNITVNCESTKKMCVLGIDHALDELTVNSTNLEQVCLFKDDSEVASTSTITTINPRTEPSKTEQATDVTHRDVVDYQSDEPVETFRSADPTPAIEEPPPVECLFCKSSSVEGCLSGADNLKPVKCPPSSQCIAVFRDGYVIRDCSSAVSSEEATLCHKPANRSCAICPTDKCNKMPWKQCYHCNSKDDPNCAYWTTEQSVPLQTCQNYEDRCSVRVTAGGDTVRECVRPDSKCPSGELCSICDGSLCNVGVFPENRRRCIQCHECEDAQNPNDAKPCARYSPEEQCFLYVTVKSKMMRGCASNAAEMQECHLNTPKCITCGDTNGCNHMPLMKDPSLSCSKCNSKTDPSCAWAQPSTALAKCQNKVLYYLEETCMMEFDPATQEATRDCSFDSGVCTPEDHNCRTCSGDGCNRGNLKFQQCIQCSSERAEEVNCARRAEGIPPTKCPQEAQKYDTRGCYAITKGNITSRGCIGDLNADDMKVCLTKGNESCDICIEDGCNNQLAPSSAWRSALGGVLMVICVISTSLVPGA